jgi:hypothetical protein
MSSYEQLIQIINLLLPAWAIGLCLVGLTQLLSRWGWPQAGVRWPIQWLLCGLIGSVVTVGGMFIYGVDGKMATYGVMCASIATMQWLLCKGWRRQH